MQSKCFQGGVRAALLDNVEWQRLLDEAWIGLTSSSRPSGSRISFLEKTRRRLPDAFGAPIGQSGFLRFLNGIEELFISRRSSFARQREKDSLEWKRIGHISVLGAEVQAIRQNPLLNANVSENVISRIFNTDRIMVASQPQLYH